MAVRELPAVTEQVNALLMEFPGKETDRAFLQRAALVVESGDDPDVPPVLRAAVAAALRRRAEAL